MASGPWEDYGPADLNKQAVEDGPWNDYAQSAEDNKRAIAPGDVAARKAQVAADAAAEQPNKVREDLSITGELGHGLKNVASGLADTAAALIPGTGVPLSTLLPKVSLDQTFGENVAAVANQPVIRAGLGAVQAASAPLAPLTNAAARAGEKVTDLTGSDALGALTESGINVLAPGALLKAPGLAAGAIEKAAPGALSKLDELTTLNKTKAARAGAQGEAAVHAAEDQAAQAIAAAQNKAQSVKDAARAKAAADIANAEKLRDVGIAESQSNIQNASKQLADVRAQEASDLANVRGNAQAHQESIDSIVQAAKESIPGREDLKSIAGDTLGEATGEKFQAHYNTVRKETKKAADELYNDALGPRESGSTVDKIDEVNQLEQRINNGEKLSADELQKLYDSAGVGPKAATGEAEKSLHDLHDELIVNRRAQRIAARNQEDNIARQLRVKEGQITAAMEEKSPGVLGKLDQADQFYRENYSPYFSKGAATRAIADKDPALIAKAAIRPTSDPKAVEKITRTAELIGDNKQLQSDVAHAHLNSLIDAADKSPDFQSAFVKQWQAYTNPSGNANKVLRTAYGPEYDRVNSFVNQMKNAKARSFDEVAKDLSAGIGRNLKAAEGSITGAAKSKAADLEALLGESPKGIDRVVKGTQQDVERIKSNLADTIRGANKEQAATVKAENTLRDTNVKLAKEKMKADLEKYLGQKGVNYEGGRFIGQLYITEGILDTLTKGAHAGAVKAITGAGLIMSRRMINAFLRSEKGVGLLKQALRNAPGTTQAAATARLIQNFASKLPQEAGQ